MVARRRCYGDSTVGVQAAAKQYGVWYKSGVYSTHFPVGLGTVEMVSSLYRFSGNGSLRDKVAKPSVLAFPSRKVEHVLGFDWGTADTILQFSLVLL